MTPIPLSDKMSNMAGATVSIRELQQNLKRVIARVEQGHVIEVTRRRRAVARLTPIRPRAEPVAWPDLDARAKAVFGARLIRPGGAEAVRQARGDR